MLPSESPEPSIPPAAASPGPTPLERAIAIFVRPASAWEGLAERAQWWIPFLITLIALMLGSGLTFQRAQLPTILDSMQEKVASGDLPAEQVQKVEEFYTSPVGMAVMLGSAGIFIAAIPFVVAMLIWFAVGFVLGAPFRFRLALEVSAWSSLVTLPAAVLQFVL